MTNKDEALKMAIEALLYGTDHTNAVKACKEALEPEPMTTTDVITCKMVGKCCMTGEALEQPAQLSGNSEQLKQEPVAWMNDIAYSDEIDNLPANRGEIIPLYSRPHQWQGLTDADVQAMWKFYDGKYYDFYTAIQQALKDKNT